MEYIRPSATDASGDDDSEARHIAMFLEPDGTHATLRLLEEAREPRISLQLPDDDHIDPLFLTAGNRILSGVRLDKVHNFDIAPTIAHLLDLQMNDLSGRVLSEALVDPR